MEINITIISNLLSGYIPHIINTSKYAWPSIYIGIDDNRYDFYVSWHDDEGHLDYKNHGTNGRIITSNDINDIIERIFRLYAHLEKL